MLSKHFEKIRQKSENYRMVYAFTVSLVFTGIISGLWVFSMFIPNFNSDSNIANSANVSGAVDGKGVGESQNYLSPTGVVKQEGGNIVDSFWNAIKGIKSNPYMGGQFEVRSDGTSGSENSNKLSTTTASGITVEVGNSNSVDSSVGIIVPSGSTGGGYVNTVNSGGASAGGASASAVDAGNVNDTDSASGN